MNKFAQNRARLAAYLDSLPDDYASFEMMVYFAEKGTFDNINPLVECKYGRENGGVDNCGAVACAIGHGPSAGLYVPESCFRGNSINWNKYVQKVFIENYEDYSGELEINAYRAYKWMFDGEWSEVDNTPRGAAKRIRYYNNDESLKDWNNRICKEAMSLYQDA